MTDSLFRGRAFVQVVKQLMEGGYRHTARARQSRWYGWSQNACFTHRLAPPWSSKDATCKLRHQCTPSTFRLLPESALSPHTTRFAYVNHLVFCKSVASRSSVMIQAKQEGRARDRKCPSWPEAFRLFQADGFFPRGGSTIVPSSYLCPCL